MKVLGLVCRSCGFFTAAAVSGMPNPDFVCPCGRFLEVFGSTWMAETIARRDLPSPAESADFRERVQS